MQKTDFHEFELFLQKSHFKSLNAQNHFFRASKNNQFCVLVQLSKLWECEATDAHKTFFLSEKKLLNAILRAKLQAHENVSF